MDITAIVPVREGSTRLKNRNAAPFAGTNLLLFKREQLKRVRELSRIVVSSDSDRMLAMAALTGVVTHKRAPEYCDERSKTFGELVRHGGFDAGSQRVPSGHVARVGRRLRDRLGGPRGRCPAGLSCR